MAILIRRGVGISGAVAGPFTPASLSGLVAWYKADAGLYQDLGTTPATANNDPVRQWNDQSGNSYNLTCNVSKEATLKTNILNSLPAVRFNGATNGFGTGVSAVSLGGTTASIYIVAMASASDAGGRLVGFLANGQAVDFDNAGSAVLLYHNSSTDHADAYRNGALSSGAMTDGTYYRLYSVYDGANNTVYVNGTGQVPVGNSDTFAATGQISVGAAFTNGALTSEYSVLDGDILEIVITNTASATDRSNMSSYFTSRYGI